MMDDKKQKNFIKSMNSNSKFQQLTQLAREYATNDPILALEVMLEAFRINNVPETQILSFFQKAKQDHHLLKQVIAGSILFENNMSDILQDAFLDGSSYICTYCQGLIKTTRKEQHEKFWCNSIENNISE